MRLIVAMASVILILLVLVDAFETMLLPRRVRRQFRFARFFYVYSWTPWAAAARLIRSEKRRNTFLSLFGPLSIIVLISVWAFGLIMGIRPLALGDRHATERNRGRRTRSLRLFQRSHVLHSGIWRCHARRATGAIAGRRRDGPRVWFPRGSHQLPSGPLPGVLPSRGGDLTARRPRRFAADGGDVPGTNGSVQRSQEARSVPRRVGTLGGRGAGEPSLVPGPQLLSIAA